MREGDVPGSRETSPFRARQNGERRRDQVDYRGPLQDPTKLPAEQAVRPPPNPVPQARPISDVTVPPDLVSVGAEPLINPWGAFGQELRSPQDRRAHAHSILAAGHLVRGVIDLRY